MRAGHSRSGTGFSQLRFGEAGGPFAMYGSNGKMSGIAAAIIVQRIEAMSDWADAYRTQRRRVTALAESIGLKVLVRPPDDAVSPHVPVMAANAIDLIDTPSPPFIVRKYYRPLSDKCPVAAHLIPTSSMFPAILVWLKSTTLQFSTI